jgi:hypothetical protein
VKAHVLLVLERMQMINGCRAYTFWLPPMFYLPSSSSLLPYLVRGKGLYGVGVRWKFCHILLLPLSHVYGWTAWSDGRQPNEVGLLLCVYKPYVIALASPSTLYFQIPIYQISNHRALTNRPTRLHGWPPTSHPNVAARRWVHAPWEIARYHCCSPFLARSK